MKCVAPILLILILSACGKGKTNSPSLANQPTTVIQAPTPTVDQACMLSANQTVSQALDLKTKTLFTALAATDSTDDSKTAVIQDYLTTETSYRSSKPSSCFDFTDATYQGGDVLEINLESMDSLMDQREAALKGLLTPGASTRFADALGELYPLFYPGTEIPNPYKIEESRVEASAARTAIPALKTYSLKYPRDLVALEKSFIDGEVQRFQTTHTGADTVTSAEVLSWLQSLAQKTPLTEIKNYKVALEKSIAGDQPILKNANASTVADFYKTTKLNARSGTYTFFLSLLPQFKTAKEFNDQHLVFIFETGHVLPGFMVPEEKKWRLYGIEMTASGDGIRDYGLTENLDQPIRIIEAIYALKVIADESKIRANPSLATKILQKSIKMTAKHYEISEEKTELKIAEAKKTAVVGDFTSAGSEVLGFGAVILPQDDQERKPVEAMSEDLTKPTPRLRIRGGPGRPVSPK